MPADVELQAPDPLVAKTADAFQQLQTDLWGGDKVAARFTRRGTHGGEFAGIAATGKPVTIVTVAIYRVANGEIVEYRLTWDTPGFMQQVGVIPAAGLPTAAW
jgi:predicted ester cyclase